MIARKCNPKIPGLTLGKLSFYFRSNNLKIDENRTMAFINKLHALIRPYNIDMTDVKTIEAGLLKSQITLDFLMGRVSKTEKLS